MGRSNRRAGIGLAWFGPKGQRRKTSGFSSLTARLPGFKPEQSRGLPDRLPFIITLKLADGIGLDQGRLLFSM